MMRSEATGLIGGAAQASDRMCMHIRKRRNRALAIAAICPDFQPEALLPITFFLSRISVEGLRSMYTPTAHIRDSALR